MCLRTQTKPRTRLMYETAFGIFGLECEDVEHRMKVRLGKLALMRERVSKMEGIEYKIRLKGLPTPEGAVPLKALISVSEVLLAVSRRALRLAVEGVSVKRGQVPKNLQKPLGFTVIGISKGSTVLQIEVPTFEDSAPELVQQPNLWDSHINPEDTVISLLSKSVHDATGGNVESDYYDRGVLESLMLFRGSLKEHIKDVEIGCSSRPSEEFKINHHELEKINKIEAETPEPKAIIVAGTFNSIKHTPRRFELVLQNGHKVRGLAEPGHISTEQMRTLWGKKVTVKGIGHFKPTGIVRYIEAQTMKPFDKGEELFETLFKNRLPANLIQDISKKQRIKSPLKEVWGKWPGDEPIEEILDTLKQISREAI